MLGLNLLRLLWKTAMIISAYDKKGPFDTHLIDQILRPLQYLVRQTIPYFLFFKNLIWNLKWGLIRIPELPYGYSDNLADLHEVSLVETNVTIKFCFNVYLLIVYDLLCAYSISAMMKANNERFQWISFFSDGEYSCVYKKPYTEFVNNRLKDNSHSRQWVSLKLC